MLQAIMKAPGRIEFQEVERPVAKADEVVIQIKRIGICGSDIHVYHGVHPYTGYPVIQGHEVSGVVAEVGSDVETLAPGNQVTFMPQVTCGSCYPCRHGMYHICDELKVMGFQTAGAAREFFAIQADKVLAVPDGISLDHAAMIEPVSVAVHAIRRGGGAAGKKVLVLGAGTIGNLVGQVARATGAEAVMITDVLAYKLDKARACGLDYPLNTRDEDLAEAIARDFGPDRADLILECVGVKETITQAVANARKGTNIVVVGVFGQKPEVDLGLVQDRELSLIGTLMYREEDYEQAIELVEGGKLCLDPLISDHYPFVDYQAAYEAIENAQGKVMKLMVVLE